MISFELYVEAALIQGVELENAYVEAEEMFVLGGQVPPAWTAKVWCHGCDDYRFQPTTTTALVVTDCHFCRLSRYALRYRMRSPEENGYLPFNQDKYEFLKGATEVNL